jgi:hypothetical protein
MLIATLCLAAAGAEPEARAQDGVVDPWAPLKPTAVAEWSPSPIALIVNPWGDQPARRVNPPQPRAPEDKLDRIIDPWGSSERHRAPTRSKSASYPRVVEIVDPWAGRPAQPPTAAFPPEGVVDPWPIRAVKPRNANQ